MSATEYEGWRRYRTIHPPEGTDLLLANLSCMAMMHMSGGKASSSKPQDFAPWLAPLLESGGSTADDAEEEVSQQRAASKAMALAWARKSEA